MGAKKKKQGKKQNSDTPWIVLAVVSVLAAIVVVVGVNVNWGDQYSDADKAAIDAWNDLQATRLSEALIQYQTNNKAKRINLPPIEGDQQTTSGAGETELDNFYNFYLVGSKGYNDYNDHPYKITFFNTVDGSLVGKGVGDLSVFYGASCDKSGKLISTGQVRQFAVAFWSQSKDAYACISD